ncbi:hypothetical protein PO369_14710 [Phytobacter diazotrophicus]|uniref:hypothetical protein n=1 Tax=Phytobacter diazotrophicus TaxID=395631 RepID=UPI002FF8C282
MKNLPKKYFLGADNELVDFLEKQGEESLMEIYRSNTINIENGYKLLNIQIVGIGSSFIILTQKTHWDYLTVGLAVFTFLWTWCAIYLVHSGLKTKIKGLICTPPDRLYTEAYKNISKEKFDMLRENGYKGTESILPLIRRYRLVDLCDTSEELLDLNVQLGRCLDRARMFTILAPIVALAASGVTFCLSL